MLNDATCFKQVYIVCGYTDLRSGIDTLASIIDAKTDLLIQNRNITIYYNRNDSALCPYQMLDILKELQKNKLDQQELQKFF